MLEVSKYWSNVTLLFLYLQALDRNIETRASSCMMGAYASCREDPSTSVAMGRATKT